MEFPIKEHIIRTVTIYLTKRIDAFTSPKLRTQLKGLQDEGVSRFIIDLSETDFLDSAGMAVLVSVLKSSRKVGGDVKLVWPKQEAAKRIISLTKFDRVFEMSHSAEAALATFK
ncbi:MAG: STAS domain-containing protein [Candidatus Promineifilaceae bacterium]